MTSKLTLMANDLAYSGIPLADRMRVATYLLGLLYTKADIHMLMPIAIEQAGSIRRADFAPRRSMGAS